jgi:hypothetical protein
VALAKELIQEYHKHRMKTHTSNHRVRLESTTAVLELENTVHTLHCAGTLIGWKK